MVENKNNIWKIILGVVLGIILIGVITFVFFICFKKDPVKIYKTAINDLYAKLDSNLENMEGASNLQLPSEPLKVSSKFKINSNIEDYQKYTDLEFNLNTYVDYPSQKLLLELITSKSNENVIKVLLSYLDGNSYLKSDELFDKVLLIGKNDIFNYTPTVEINDNPVDVEDLRFILESLKDIFIDSLDKEYFKVSDDRVTIKDKDYSVTKYTYVIDDENSRRTVDFIVNKILDSDELLDSIASLCGMSVEELETSLNNSLEKLENKDDIMDTVNLSLYVKSNEVLMTEIEENGVFIKYSDVDDLFEFLVLSNDSELKVYEDIDGVNFFMRQNNQELFNGTATLNDEEFKVNLTMNSQGVLINLFFEINNIDVQDEKNSFDISMGMNMSVLGESYNLSIDGECVTTKGEEVPTIDVTNAVDVNNLTDEEKESISLKLNSILSRLGLSDVIQN